MTITAFLALVTLGLALFALLLWALAHRDDHRDG